MNKYITILLVLSCIAFSCERDDICPESTPTTPRLIIDFLDLQNEDIVKSAANFRVEVTDNPEMVIEDYQGDTTVSNIILPLKTSENETSFVFYKDYEEDTDGTVINGNPDNVIITYETEEIYVSRACGYKTIFKNVTIAVENDTDNWINLIEPVNVNQSIEDESTTHFNLLH